MPKKNKRRRFDFAELTYHAVHHSRAAVDAARCVANVVCGANDPKAVVASECGAARLQAAQCAVARSLASTACLAKAIATADCATRWADLESPIASIQCALGTLARAQGLPAKG